MGLKNVNLLLRIHPTCDMTEVMKRPDSWERKFSTKLVAAGLAVSTGMVALAGCGGNGNKPSAPKVTPSQQSSSPSVSPKPTEAGPTQAPTSEAGPTVTYAFTQDQINQLEANTNVDGSGFDDSQVEALQQSIETLAANPEVWAKATSSNPRIAASALCAANEAAFRSGDVSIVRADYGQFEGDGAGFNIDYDTAEMNKLIYQKNLKGPDQVTGYSCTLSKALDPAHIPSLATTPWGQKLAAAKDQVVPDPNGTWNGENLGNNYYVAAHMLETETLANGSTGILRDEDVVLYIFNQYINNSNGQTVTVYMSDSLFNRDYYQNNPNAQN